MPTFLMRWLTSNASQNESRQASGTPAAAGEAQMHLWMHFSIGAWPFPFCIYYSIIMESHFAYTIFSPAVTFYFAYFFRTVMFMAENNCPCQKNPWGFRVSYKGLLIMSWSLFLRYYGTLNNVYLEQTHKKIGLQFSKLPTSMYTTLQINWKTLNTMFYSHSCWTMYWFMGTLKSWAKVL